MGYNTDDCAALEAARSIGIEVDPVEVPDLQASVMRFGIAKPICAEDAAPVLGAAFYSAERFFNSGATTTLWVDVKTTDLPAFVLDAIKGIKGGGLSIIVTHDGSSTHKPGPLLSAAICAAAEAVGGGGFLWHPIAQQTVSVYSD